MFLLGLNAYHGDSAAAILRDGELIAAAEEERFRRLKHWAGLPIEAIRYCLKEAGINFSQVDHVAMNRKPGSNNLRRATFVLTQRPNWRLVLERVRGMGKVATLESALVEHFPADYIRAEVHFVEHHMAHLASAFFVSDFDEAAAVSVDGFGDFASAAWGMGRGSDITIDGRVFFPHSLGIFYTALTQYLGFPHYGDEYKVMGLAPYGKPHLLPEMRRIVRVQSDGTYELNLDFFLHHKEQVAYSWNNCSPEVGTLYSEELVKLLGPARANDEPLSQRHKDIARSVQAMYEEAFFALLNAVYEKYRCPNLALAGGCAMNSVANGKVYHQTPFRRMYLPAAAGDAGGAIGSALFVWKGMEERPRTREQRSEVRSRKSDVGSQKSEVGGQWSVVSGPVVSGPVVPLPGVSGPRRSGGSASAYTGPQFSNAEIEELLRSRGLWPLESEARSQRSDVGNPRSDIRSPTSDRPLPLRSGERAGVRCSADLGDNQKLDVQSQTPEVGSPTSDLRPPSSDVRSQKSEVSGPVVRGPVVRSLPSPGALCTLTARALAAGKVVGWFQGRMEWGPRALGNRSILCDPRRADMKEILNAKIKRRESFRPFAPSILREHVAEWFETDDDVPYMMQVFQFRAEKRSLVPAVCHVDGSGRLHTVTREANPLFCFLLSAFCSLTSVPMLLNTSFNENEPVVCRPEEALDCFLRTQMDVLVLGNFFVERKS